MKNIEYINIEYLWSTIGFIDSITSNNVAALKEVLNSEVQKLIKTTPKIDLLVVDMYNTSASYSNKIPNKGSNLHNLFEDIEADDSIKKILLATNSRDPLTNSFLIEKDFPNSKKVFVTSFLVRKKNTPNDYERSIRKDDYDVVKLEHSDNVPEDVIKDVNNIVFGTDSLIGSKEKYLQFISERISNRIKTLLLNNNCIEPIKEEDHVLKSTPVHVNKYVNLKPILEKHDCFNEMCCLLYHQIERTCGTPDFVVASSRNSIYIASGLLKYFKQAEQPNVQVEQPNMIIIDQISPVTKLTNFSNLDSIIPNRKYAIIEDFYCMGTEIKMVKSVLWSRGVDIDNTKHPIYAFPIVSSNLYGEKTDKEFQKKKIYPLHILDKYEKYLMFTSSCCPVCNEIDCNHRREFNFKK